MSQDPVNPIMTAAVLLYGDTPHLARRCLAPLRVLRNTGLIDLRVGANEPSEATLQVCREFGIEPVVAAPQIMKYPMMRKLFHDKPIETDLTMWFDDDSYINLLADYPDTSADILATWLREIVNQFRTKNVAMLGSIYHPGYVIAGDALKWFCRRYPSVRSLPMKPKFCTGGWWTIRTSILDELNWPHPDLSHNGGDVALGALMGAHGYHLYSYKKGVLINAGDTGKESAAPRRGVSEQPPFLS